MRIVLACAIVTAAAGCGSSGTPTGPSSASVTVTANPSQVTGAPCTGCGAASTDREVLTTLSIQETAGVGGNVTAIEMTLRETATGAVITSGSFDAGAVTQLAGSSRVPAHGTLSVRCGVHYPAAQAGRAAALTYVIRVTDDRGNQLSQTVTVSATT